MPTVDPRLIDLAIQEAPNLINFLTGLYTSKHPDAPAPSSDDVIAAYNEAFASSLAKDARWLAAHPPTA
jgi:hypothetical protein